MANTIKIDPRLILPWTTGTQYRVVVTEGLVNEVGNNRTPSPLTTSSISTFQDLPTVVSTVPVNGATDGFASTATLTYTRPLFISTGTNNFYLYQEDGATDILVATIPTTSTRVTQVGKTVSISFRDLLVPEQTYYLTADANLYTDLFKFGTVEVTDDTIFKYTPGPAADIISITPTYGQENTFVNSATIVYNRSLTVQTGNYYLNSTATGVVRTFDVTTLPLTTSTDSSTIRLTFDDLALPEGEYFLTNDQGVYKDQHNFPLLAVNDDSEMKWFNTSISNMTSRPYRGEQPTAIFTGTVPQVLDIDLNTATQYTFTLASPIGEFSSPLGGTDEGSYWTFTGTKQQINALISSIVFTTNEIVNPNSTYTYSLEKNGIMLVNKEKTLQGVLLALGALGPTGKAFPRLTLSIDGNTTINEPFNVIASINTSTELRGTLQFKEGNTVFSSTQISSSGTAITSVNYTTTGTRSLSVSWLADELINNFAYEPLDSFDTRIFVDTAAVLPGDVVASVENIPSLRVPAGPEITLVGELPGSFDYGGIVTFKSIVEETTETNYVDTVSINITNVGNNGTNYYIDVDNVYDLTSSTWVKITATVSQVGSIESNYQIKEVSGNRIIFETRSEDDNLYYGYDPLRDEIATPNLVTLNPIVKQANLFGSRTVRQSETVLTTATVVNNVARMPMSFVNSGTYKFVADWSGRGVAPKYFAQNSPVSQLIIDERAQYDGNLVVTPNPNPVHQLSTATINIVGTINTATTGTVRLIELHGNTSTVLATSAFPGTNTFNFVLDPNTFATSGTNHTLKISWDGQEWIPNQFFPYYPKDSNTVTQTVELAQLAVTVDPLNTVNLLTKVVATANTSSARSGFVQFYRNNLAFGQPVATVNNSATIENFVASGTSTFRATWLDTFPLVNSNTASTRVVAYQSPSISFTRSTSTFVYYNQDETVNANNIIINTSLVGTVSTRPPEGNITIVDSVVGAISTASVIPATLTNSTATSIWNPFTQGQTVGTRSLSIVYSGDGWNRSITTSTSVNLIKPTATIALTATSTASFWLGYPITFTATIPQGTKLSSALQIIDGSNNVVGTTTFNGNTATVDIVPVLAFTGRAYRARYEESTFHALSQSNQLSVSAAKRPTTFTLTKSTSTFALGMPITIEAIAGAPQLSGPVVFTAGGQTFSRTFSGATATLTTSLPTVGTYTVSASYASTAIENAFTTSTSTITILPKFAARTTLVLSTSSNQVYEQDGITINTASITATITLVGTYLNHPPTGTVELVDSVKGVVNTTVISSTATGLTSTVIVSYSPNDYNGTIFKDRTVSVNYQGDDWNSAASSSTAFTSFKQAPTISAFGDYVVYENSIPTVYYGDTMGFTATFAVLDELPSTVSFYDTTVQPIQLLGTADVIDGKATINNITLSSNDERTIVTQFNETTRYAETGTIDETISRTLRKTAQSGYSINGQGLVYSKFSYWQPGQTFSINGVSGYTVTRSFIANNQDPMPSFETGEANILVEFTPTYFTDFIVTATVTTVITKNSNEITARGGSVNSLGLVLHTDPGHRTSYSGGTTIVDRSPSGYVGTFNKVGTATNALTFAGEGSSTSLVDYNYISFGSNTPNIKVQPGSSITVQFWVKGGEPQLDYGPIFNNGIMGVQRQGTPTQFGNDETNLGNFEVLISDVYNIEGPDDDIRAIHADTSLFDSGNRSYGISANGNTWVFVTLTYTASVSTTGGNTFYNWHDWTTRFSVNGGALSAPDTKTAGYIPTTQGNFNFGAWRPGELSPRDMAITQSFQGSLGPVMIYNRILNNAEIAANYLAFKNRYIQQ